jgi:hypothetical protein
MVICGKIEIYRCEIADALLTATPKGKAYESDVPK